MLSSRLLQAFAVALSTSAVVHATLADSNYGAPAFNEIVKRQTGGSSTRETSSTGTSTSVPSSTSSTSSTIPTPPPPSTTTTSSRTTPTTAPTTTDGSTTPPPTTSSDTSSSSPPALSTLTTTVTTTGADGQLSTYTSASISTQSSSLANNGSNAPSGIDEKTRNTIIGVVVGVGGAIILGVVGLVAWRIWGRKKQQEEAENFGSTYTPVDKTATEPSGSTNSRTPFQSTLESYHAPTQVNASSNF